MSVDKVLETAVLKVPSLAVNLENPQPSEKLCAIPFKYVVHVMGSLDSCHMENIQLNFSYFKF